MYAVSAGHAARPCVFAMVLTLRGLVQVLGPNPACVEVRSDGGAAAWQLVGFLEKGQSQPVGPGTRFYVVDRANETAIEVVAADDDGAAASGSGEERAEAAEASGAKRASEATDLPAAGPSDEVPKRRRSRSPSVELGAVSATRVAAASSSFVVPSMSQAPFSLMRVR